MNIKPVLFACAQLHQEGKEVSIALIKQKLSSPLPLATLVKGKSYFTQNKQSVLIMLEQESKQKQTDDIKLEKQSTLATTKPCEHCRQLQAEITQLQQVIKALQVEVEALKNG